MIKRILLTLSIAAALVLPVKAQFAITLQQNGQGSAIASGNSIVMNAPTLGQTATATVVVTFVGTGTANFPSNGQLFGSSSYTVSGGDSATSLNPFQSVSFAFNYTPPSTAQNTAEFLWPFNQTTTVTTSTGPVTTVTASGAISFNLVGTSPNLVVGQVATSGFQTIPDGGTFQYPNTLLNTVSTTTISIANSGSGPGIVNSIAVTGAGYTLTGLPLLPLTIAAGSQLNIPVQFQPKVAGPASGSLQVAFANGNYAATLAGTGISSFLSYNITQGATTSALNPGDLVAMGSTNLGTPVSAIIQFQNTGSTPFVLGTLAVSGAGFTITAAPFIPVTIQPQQSDSITITYNPTVAGPSTGRLLIGNDSFGISGQALGSTLTFSYQAANGVAVPLLAGGTVSFSPVVDGQTTSVPFTITNTGNSATTLSTIGAVDPTGVFTVSNVPALPLQLSPGGSVTFTVNFSPVSTGISSATLVINNQSFGLSGFPATPPPLPAYSFTGASGTQQPFTQPAIGLSLATPYAYPLAGTLTISVVTNNFVPDPAVQFSSGGLQIAFTIPANTLKAVFAGGATQVQLQTGTLVANITVTPVFRVGTATGTNITPTNPTQLTLTVPAAAPTLLTAAITSQTTKDLQITIAGFSDTRSLDHMNFQLTAAPGFTLSGTSFPIDVNATSALFFQSAASQGVGGQFTAVIPLTFTQTGSTTTTNLTAAISAISLSATNSTGTSNSLNVTVP